MMITDSAEQLIVKLEQIKARFSPSAIDQNPDEFKAILGDVTAKIDALTIDIAEADNRPTATNVLPHDETSLLFEEFMHQNYLLSDQKIAKLHRPNMKNFMDATGVSAADAAEILYGVIGVNADLRDWSKIMKSSSPVNAARAATNQLYNLGKDYELVNHDDFGTVRFAKTLRESSLSSVTVYRESKNFADVETDGLMQTMAVSNSGLMLRGAGSTAQQIERTAWLFGFETPEWLV